MKINDLVLQEAKTIENEKQNKYIKEQRLRSAINTEYDAIQYYQNLLDTFKDDDHAIDVLTDIIEEEKVHVEQLRLLLNTYDDYSEKAVERAEEENSGEK